MRSIIVISIFLTYVIVHGHPAKNGRLIGGITSHHPMYPFISSLTINKEDGGRYFCAGSLISTQWLLTAGQCVDKATLFTVILGSESYKPTQTSSTVATSEFVLHPDYNEPTLEHDIGLVEFRFPVEFGDNIQSVPFLSSAPAADPSVRVIGWGQRSDEDADLSETLEEVYLSTIPLAECRITYGDFLKEGMLCAAGNFNEGLCYGDIGGPLLQTYGRYFTLVGVASFFSQRGCESADPSGFTDVSVYRSWIQETSGI